MFKRPQRRTDEPQQGRKALSKTLPYWDLEGDIMILRDGRLLYGFYFEPPTHLQFTADNLEQRSRRLKAVFDLAVPDGETLTTYTSLRTAHREAVADTRVQAAHCLDPVIRQLSETRAAMLEAKITRGEVSHWSFYATVTVTPPREDRFDVKNPPSQAELCAAVENAAALQAATVAQVRAAGFGAEMMGAQAVFNECFFYLNPGWPHAPAFVPPSQRELRSVRRGVPDTQTLIRQLTTTTGNNLHPGALRLGDHYVDVLSISRLPEYTETGYLREITDELHGTYYVVVQARRENDYAVSNELEKKKNDLWTRVKSKGVIPNGRAVNLLEQVEQAQKLEGLESRFDAAVSVILVAQSLEELASMKRQARGNLTRLRAGMPITYGFQADAQYYALAPFGGGQSGFQFKPYTTSVIDLFPPVSPWKGFAEGAITYQNRDRALIKFDLFTPSAITAHFAVYAPTGSGKTVLVQSLLSAELTRYPDAVLLVTDTKRDFAYYFRSIQDAQIINFGYDSETRLNVFDLEAGADTPDGEKLSALMTFCRLFVEAPQDGRTKGYEDVALTEGLMAVYAQFREEARAPQMSDLYQMLTVIENYTDSGKQMEEPVIQAARSVGVRLRKALGTSPVAAFVDCQSNVSLSARRLYFSLYGVPEDDELMKRLSQHLIKNAIWTVARSYPRGVKKFVFFDEFESQVQTEEELDSVRRMLRVFRSFGVSFGCGTQSGTASARFGDLRDSFAHLFVGRFSRDVAKDVVSVLSLPEVMTELLPTLQNVPGHYAEFALLTQAAQQDGNKSGDIIRVEESRLALWLFNSGHDEVALKDEYVARAGGDVMKGVRTLVTEKFGGYV